MLARPDEEVCLRAHRHTAAVVPALALALLLAGAAAPCFRYGSAGAAGGGALLAAAALVALRAVWRWDRTEVVVTTEKLFVVEGTLRRRAESVPLRTVEALALEQTLTGRLLGYGTLVAGPLEVRYVPDAKRVYRLVESLAA